MLKTNIEAWKQDLANNGLHLLTNEDDQKQRSYTSTGITPNTMSIDVTALYIQDRSRSRCNIDGHQVSQLSGYHTQDHRECAQQPGMGNHQHQIQANPEKPPDLHPQRGDVRHGLDDHKRSFRKITIVVEGG